MTITPFVDLKSEDILSAHISGLQHAINKIETTLNEKQTVITGHALIAVTDQADTNLHNLIYEGTVRNWLSTPAPVVKRNGTIVDASEYKIEPAYGVVVFYAQQNPSDAITADITYVSGGSSVIDGMNQSISDNATNIAANASAIQTNANNVAQNTAAINAVGLMQGIIGNYFTHGNLAGTYATGVGVGGNNMDAFPFPVTQPTVYDKMKINIAALAGSKCVMAIYSDNNGYPGNLLAQTSEIDTSTTTGTTGVHEVAFTTGDLTLQPGLYWLIRWQDGAITVSDGLNNTAAYSLGDTTDTTKVDISGVTNGMPIAGVRVNITYDGVLRNPFWTTAQGAKYLKRVYFGSPWIHRKS